MEWYKSLTIEQKINLKDCCSLIVGIAWKDLILLFSMKEGLDIIYKKLRLEGFDI